MLGIGEAEPLAQALGVLDRRAATSANAALSWVAWEIVRSLTASLPMSRWKRNASLRAHRCSKVW